MAFHELIRRTLPANSRLRITKRLLERKLRARGNGYLAWGPILDRSRKVWSLALENRRNGPRILIATSVGSHLPGTTLDSVLAAALTLRGANVEMMLCDEILPACLAADATWFANPNRFALRGPQADLCADCFAPAAKMYRQLGLEVYRYSELLDDGAREVAARFTDAVQLHEAASACLEGMAVGEHAVAGALRYFARADLRGESTGAAVLRRYLQAAALSALAGRSLLRSKKYDCVVLHHGIYVPQGSLAEAARAESVRIVTWNPAYRKRCFLFSHGDTYHRTLLDELVSAWDHLRLTESQEQELTSYLQGRAVGAYDWIWFHERPNFDREQLYARFGLRRDVPIVGLLTNVIWDAQLHYPANLFSGMREWIVETIRYFARRPDLQLLIRIHPAEIRGTLPSRQRVDDEIRQAFPILPHNVVVIPPEDNTSTYVAMGACDSVLIYGTKTGVELTSVGIPVIVAGEAWIRNKGLTLDPPTRTAYFELLGRLPSGRKMSDEEVARARRYAFHFFFRRMIPLEFMEPVPGWPPYRPKLGDLTPLVPGRSRGLDIICDGILSESEFVYPAETAGVALA